MGGAVGKATEKDRDREVRERIKMRVEARKELVELAGRETLLVEASEGQGERKRQRQSVSVWHGVWRQVTEEGSQREEISSERRDSVRILYNRSTVRRPTKYVQLRNDKRYLEDASGRPEIKWRGKERGGRCVKGFACSTDTTDGC